jgi:hypothetical protein
MVDVNGATITVPPHSLPRSEPISPLATASLKRVMDSDHINTTTTLDRVDVPSNEQSNRNDYPASSTNTTTVSTEQHASSRLVNGWLSHYGILVLTNRIH